MNNMKNKTFLSIAIFTASLFIIPQITFASWWNPGTWKIFNKKSEVKIERAMIATSTPDNRIARTEKATTTEKIEQKSEEAKKTKATDNFANKSAQKKDVEKEIEKLKKEVEELKKKQANSQQSAVSAQTPVTTPTIQSTDNSYLKVERCKADKDQFRSELEQQVLPMVEESFNKCKYDAIKNAEAFRGILTASEILEMSGCSDQRPTSARIRADFDRQANNRYNECINKI